MGGEGVEGRCELAGNLIMRRVVLYLRWRSSARRGAVLVILCKSDYTLGQSDTRMSPARGYRCTLPPPPLSAVPGRSRARQELSWLYPTAGSDNCAAWGCSREPVVKARLWSDKRLTVDERTIRRRACALASLTTSAAHALNETLIKNDDDAIIRKNLLSRHSR